MRFLLKILLNALAVVVTSYLLEGVAINNYLTAVLVAIVLGIVNVTVKPILQILTLPITFLTLGLFLLVINAMMILLVDWLVPGFEVKNIMWALLFSIIMAVITYIFDILFIKNDD